MVIVINIVDAWWEVQAKGMQNVRCFGAIVSLLLVFDAREVAFQSKDTSLASFRVGDERTMDELRAGVVQHDIVLHIDI